MNSKYNEIMDLPHHVSKNRPQMPMSDRAAQFAPFAALTGYDDAVKETGRLTDDKIELEESSLNELNAKIAYDEFKQAVYAAYLESYGFAGETDEDKLRYLEDRESQELIKDMYDSNQNDFKRGKITEGYAAGDVSTVVYNLWMLA